MIRTAVASAQTSTLLTVERRAAFAPTATRQQSRAPWVPVPTALTALALTAQILAALGEYEPLCAFHLQRGWRARQSNRKLSSRRKPSGPRSGALGLGGAGAWDRRQRAVLMVLLRRTGATAC